MNIKIKKLLFDFSQSAEAIAFFTQDTKSFLEYSLGLITRSSVERQFIIIGEAVTGCANMVLELPALRSVVSFRNRLVHAYE